MRKTELFVVGLLVALGANTVLGDITVIITTDEDLNDSGGVDEFVPIPADGMPRTVYIWGSATPDTGSIFEFNFDLTDSGNELSYGNAVIAPFFNDIENSLSDTNLNDLQFGWSAFFGTPPTVPIAPPYTLFATVDVAITPGTLPGPDTTMDLRGPDFRIIDADLNEIVATGTSRDLAVGCEVNADCDDGNPCTDDTCNAGICEYAYNTDPCDDGLYCTGTDTCDGAGTCTHTGDPCAAGEVCDDSIDFCIQVPTVTGVGPRYLRIDVNSANPSVVHAIRVRDTAAGLDKFVQPAGVSDDNLHDPNAQHGELVDGPVCHSDGDWDVVYVSDAFICPDTEYEITVATGVSCTTGALTGSNAATGTTYKWGDLDNDSLNRIVDVMYAIDGFLHRSNAPTYVSDVGTDGDPGLPNAPDRDTTMHDIMNVMDALLGESYPYSCEPTMLAQVEPASTVDGTLLVQPRQRRIRAGDTVVVDLFLSSVSNLRGYELALDITPKRPRSLTSSLIVEGAEVNESHASFAFRDLDYEAIADPTRVRLGSALYSGSISVGGEPVYLGSFTLRASEDARGKFMVTVWPVGPAMLLDPVGAEIVPAELNAGIIHVLKKPKWPRGGR